MTPLILTLFYLLETSHRCSPKFRVGDYTRGKDHMMRAILEGTNQTVAATQ